MRLFAEQHCYKFATLMRCRTVIALDGETSRPTLVADGRVADHDAEATKNLPVPRRVLPLLGAAGVPQLVLVKPTKDSVLRVGVSCATQRAR